MTMGIGELVGLPATTLSSAPTAEAPAYMTAPDRATSGSAGFRTPSHRRRRSSCGRRNVKKWSSRSRGNDKCASYEGQDRGTSLTTRLRAAAPVAVTAALALAPAASADTTPVFTLQGKGIWNAAQPLIGGSVYTPLSSKAAGPRSLRSTITP